MLLLTVACGVKESEYAHASLEVDCERVMACSAPESLAAYGFEDQADCEAAFASDYEGWACVEDTRYFKSRAEDCLEQTSSLSCEDFNAGKLPEVCDEVCG